MKHQNTAPEAINESTQKVSADTWGSIFRKKTGSRCPAEWRKHVQTAIKEISSKSLSHKNDKQSVA